MSETFTSYSVDNDRRFRNALSTASATIGDFRLPFGLILRDFYRSEQAIFSLKGPGKYPPFKHSVRESTGKNGSVDVSKSPYQRYKLKKYGFDYPLLVRTGAMSASLLGPTNKGSVANITKLSLIFGTTIAYTVFHQSDAPRKKIPQRKILFIGPEAPTFATSDQIGRLERWIGYISDHVANVAIKSGLASRVGVSKA